MGKKAELKHDIARLERIIVNSKQHLIRYRKFEAAAHELGHHIAVLISLPGNDNTALGPRFARIVDCLETLRLNSTHPPTASESTLPDDELPGRTYKDTPHV